MLEYNRPVDNKHVYIYHIQQYIVEDFHYFIKPPIPLFFCRCERKDDNSVYLHYFTERTGLHPIVLGI